MEIIIEGQLMNCINESELNETERLGLAWCRLNNGMWDPLLGTKPEEFHTNPTAYLIPAMEAIEGIIGFANCDWAWWRFGLKKSREEWLQWWLTKDFPIATEKANVLCPIKVLKKTLQQLRRR